MSFRLLAKVAPSTCAVRLKLNVETLLRNIHSACTYRTSLVDPYNVLPHMPSGLQGVAQANPHGQLAKHSPYMHTFIPLCMILALCFRARHTPPGYLHQ